KHSPARPLEARNLGDVATTAESETCAPSGTLPFMTRVMVVAMPGWHAPASATGVPPDCPEPAIPAPPAFPRRAPPVPTSPPAPLPWPRSAAPARAPPSPRAPPVPLASRVPPAPLASRGFVPALGAPLSSDEQPERAPHAANI